jgi:hypothetical protein
MFFFWSAATSLALSLEGLPLSRSIEQQKKFLLKGMFAS